jgi:hypothetical protein
MNSFQIIVLSIATVVLILVLTLIGITMSGQNGSTVFPPTAADCPDYWPARADGSGCNIPLPVKGSVNLGGIYDKGNNLLLNAANTNASLRTDATGTNYINFSDSKLWSGVCAKKKWAASNNIFWDGVSNYNGTC